MARLNRALQKDSMDRILDLLKQDPVRLEALSHAYKLNLPDCYLAAGFVRNLVWDSLHGFEKPTPLNDVDLIYFDPREQNPTACLEYESQLKQCMPSLNWQVRNQARMHTRNGDRLYVSSLDAMSFWPEKETAIGVRQVEQGRYECVSAFDIEPCLRALLLTTPSAAKRYSRKEWNRNLGSTIGLCSRFNTRPKLKVSI
ncbi:hypothetical protein JCM19232_3470 [Vibrio ishigakensis]|uniref:Nitrate reductase n=1 Tax=Vibrio ishigakensis TaxID=1481914 RepID=A0A0B8PND5_9VIBR|nr:hypothetical protein JCM19232_3470 [Vibrio ishigakensis]